MTMTSLPELPNYLELEREPLPDSKSLPAPAKTSISVFQKPKKNKKKSNPSKQQQKKQEDEQKWSKEDEEERRLTSLLFGAGAGMFIDTTAEETDVDDDVSMVDVTTKNGDATATATASTTSEGVDFVIDRVGVVSQEDETETKSLIQTETKSLIQTDTQSQTTDDDDTTNTDDSIQNAAWYDSDDERVKVSLAHDSFRIRKLRKSHAEDMVDGVEYQRRLRERHRRTIGQTIRTDWADLPSDYENRSDSDTDSSTNPDALFSSNVPILSKTRCKLLPHIIDTERVTDVNLHDPNQSVLQTVQFHRGKCDHESYDANGPIKPLLMTAGTDKMLRFFRVDVNGKEHVKVHGIHFPDLPIRCASFIGETGNAIVSGKRPFVYFIDGEAGKIDKIPFINGHNKRNLDTFTISPDGSLIAFATGEDGYIVVVDARSKTWVTDMKINGSSMTVAFENDGNVLTSAGSDGDVYRFDMRNYKCMHKFSNIDGSKIYSLATSSMHHLAVGSESGVVNLYDHASLKNCSSNSGLNPTPIKTISNMQTSINQIKFNPDSQILAMSTRMEKDGFKLFHMASQTMFSNWPTNKTPLGYVWSMDFSPGKGKLLAVGNDKGKCLLYKLKHYYQ